MKNKLFLLLAALSMILFAWAQGFVGLKDFGNRIEGSSVQNHAAEDLRVVGIHRSFDAFPRKAEVKVRFFLPPNSDPRAVLIQATEREDFKHYLMESKPASWKSGGWNVFAPWKTTDVIDKLDVKAANIAVVARLSRPQASDEFIPVDVSAGVINDRKSFYTFYFATSRDLHSLAVNVFDADGTETKVKAFEQCTFFVDCAIYAAQSTQAVTLDFSLLPQGEYVVAFSGTMPGRTDTVSLVVPVYHKPD